MVCANGLAYSFASLAYSLASLANSLARSVCPRAPRERQPLALELVEHRQRRRDREREADFRVRERGAKRGDRTPPGRLRV